MLSGYRRLKKAGVRSTTTSVAGGAGPFPVQNCSTSIIQQNMASKLPSSVLRSTRLSLKKRRAVEPRQCLRNAATHTHSHHAHQISILRSSVDTSSEDFKENSKQMDEVVGKLKELRRTISQGGTAKAREKHIKRGKMLPRECVWTHS